MTLLYVAQVLAAVLCWTGFLFIVAGWIENRRNRWVADIDRRVNERIWQ